MKNEIKNPMERFISNEEINLFGDGGVSDCDNCNNPDGYNKDEPETPSTTDTPTGNGGTTFVCSECGRTCDCVNMSVENNICQKCYEEFYTPEIDKFPDPEPDPDGGTTFVCSECGRTCDCGNMSAEEGICICCYCPTPDIDEEEEENTPFFCTECEKTYESNMESEDPTLCKNCYAALHTPPVDDEEEEEDNTDTEVTEPILVSNISFDRTALAVDEGSNFIIYVTVSPENATDTSLEWSSSDNEVATVTSEGFVAAWKAGEAIITATARDGSGVSETCHVTVRPIPVNKVTVEPKSVTLAAGEKSYLYAEVCPCDASNQTVNWYSDNEGIVSVDDGVVIAHSDGVATITAISEDGSKRDTCTVTVDSRERVVVEKDSHSFVVKFEDGKIWKNIGLDISRREENYGAMFPVDFDRKYYEDLIPEEQRYLDNLDFEFSEQQLGILYLIDPLGVEYYMRNDACVWFDLEVDFLRFKDRLYKEIFGVYPRLHYVYTADMVDCYEYFEDITDDVRLHCFSDAEALFGDHDFLSIGILIDFALDVLPGMIKGLFIAISPAFEFVSTIIDVSKFLFYSEATGNVLSEGGGRLADEYVKEITILGKGEKSYEQFCDKFKPKMQWASQILQGLLLPWHEVWTPSVEEIITYHKVDSTNYCVKYKIDGLEKTTAEVIARISEN